MAAPSMTDGGGRLSKQSMRGLEIGMVRRYLAYTVIAACSAAALLSSAHAGPRAVIELFTSQGCSSCPPADRLLGELAADPSLVALSLPVDYWDYLGWKDTLADKRNSARQTGYMKARGDRERYTPQAVINGVVHALGSSREAIEKAILKSRQNLATLSVPVEFSVAHHQAVVTVSAAGAVAAGANVWIAGLRKNIPVAIGRGENKGRTVVYHNVVRNWTRLGAITGKGSVWHVAAAVLDHDGIDGAAVLIQSGTIEKPGPMLGAAFASLR
jgi:hypothetical protein